MDGESDSSPRSVVQYAKKRYQEDKEIQKRNGDTQSFNRIYCVFDQDEHPTYSEALNRVHQINQKLKSTLFFAIISVPCFEFWILLHFEFSTAPIVRQGEQSPGDLAKKKLRKYLPNYSENNKDIYQQTKPYLEEAILRAKKVEATSEKEERENPRTTVHLLVEYLRNLKGSQ